MEVSRIKSRKSGIGQSNERIEIRKINNDGQYDNCDERSIKKVEKI